MGYARFNGRKMESSWGELLVGRELLNWSFWEVMVLFKVLGVFGRCWKSGEGIGWNCGCFYGMHWLGEPLKLESIQVLLFSLGAAREL